MLGANFLIPSIFWTGCGTQKERGDHEISVDGGIPAWI